MPKERTLSRMLSLLSPKEEKAFMQYLEEQLADRQHKLIILCRSIIHNHSINEIWQNIFPNSQLPQNPYTYSGYRKLEFQLSSHLESFLAIQAFIKDKTMMDLYLIKALNQRKAGTLFETKLKKIKGRMDKVSIRDESYYKARHQLDREEQHFHLKKMIESNTSLEPKLNQSLDVWWLHEKLKIAIFNLNYRFITGKHYSSILTEEILTYTRTLSAQEYPVIHMYTTVYDALTAQETTINLHHLVENNKDLLSKDSLKDLFSSVLSYYIRLNNKLRNKLGLEKLFGLYEWGIRDRLVFKDEFLVWAHYKNFATICIRLNKYDTAKTFIEEYKIYIPANHREDAYRFSLAEYYFTQRAYKEVINLLSTKFQNIYYEIQARFKVLQAQYEFLSDEDLLRASRSLRVFIERQKTFPKEKKTNEIAKIKFFEKLVKAYTKKEFEKLEGQISNTSDSTYRIWFMEKITAGKTQTPY